MRRILAVLALCAAPVHAEESRLVSLETTDAGAGWQAVGRLNLGTWQGIYLFEHRHGAHSRNVIAHIVP